MPPISKPVGLICENFYPGFHQESMVSAASVSIQHHDGKILQIVDIINIEIISSNDFLGSVITGL